MLRTVLTLLAALTFLSGPALADPPAVTWDALQGPWKTYYIDAELGGVPGEAKVDGQTVTLTLTDPRDGVEVDAPVRSASIEGGELVLELGGPGIQPDRETGEGYPEQTILLPAPEPGEIRLTGGTEDLAIEVEPVGETDTDRVEVRLKLVSDTAMAGRWRYRANPFIARDVNGEGRDGFLEEDGDGTWWVTGGEAWRRPVPQVYGAVPVQDQLAKEMFSDGTSMAWYAYPFHEDAADSGRLRTLFVFGKDLPKDWSQPRAELDSGSPGVTYVEIARLSDFKSAESRRADYRPEVAERDREMDDFTRGREIVKKRLDEAAAANVDELDAVILRATLDEDVVPGWQTFTYAGSEAAWLLQFGDNTATLRIVRKVDRQSDRHEPTGILYAGETFRIEIETKFALPVDSIPVIAAAVPAGAKFDDWSKGGVLMGDGDGIAAIRSAENRRIYRTEFIRTDPRVPRDKAVEAGGGSARHLLHGSQGTRVFAMISSPGTVSIPPPMAQATVFMTAGDTAVGGDWKRWLADAAACAGIENTDRIATERAEAETISEFLINSGVSRFPIPGWFDSKVSVGQHAGMLLMRDTFVRQLERNRAGMARLETDEEILAFRRAMEPIVRQEQTPLTRIEVTDIDGGKTTFDWTFEKAIIGDVHDKRIDEVERWAIQATREALRTYTDLMYETARETREIDPCDVEALLKLTGYEFEAVAALAKAKLMTPAAAPLYWAPDYRARAHVDNVALVADSVEIGEKLGEEDRREALLAVAVATIPVAIVGGMAGSSAAIIASFAVDVIDVAVASYSEISEKIGRDAAYDFALAAADVTGMRRLERAEERQRSWAAVVGALFPTVTFATIGAVIDVPDLYKAFREGLYITKAARGRRAMMEALEIEPAAAGAPARAEQVAQELEESLERSRVAQAAGDAPETPTPLTGSSPDIDAGLSSPARGVRFDELPDAFADSADDIFRYLDDMDSSDILSQLDEALVESAERAAKGGDETTAAGGEALSPASRDLVDRLIARGRADVLDLMEEAGTRIAKLLDDADPDRARYAREVLESDPGLDAAKFEAAVETLYKRRPRSLGEDFYAQADPANRELGMALEDAGWRFDLDIDGVDGNYKIFDPDRRHAEVTRSFDPATGTFKMSYAVAEVKPRPTGPVIDGLYEVNPGFVRGKIDDVLPVPNAGSGVPTIQYFTMRLMQKLGVKFGATGDGAIRKAVMSSIANVRTITTLEYLRKLHYPNLPLEDVPAEEMSRWLMMSHSVRYAEGVLAGAGYKVTGANLKFGLSSFSAPTPYPISLWEDFFDARAETLIEFLARHGMTPDSRAVGNFSIELAVEPL